MKALAGAVIGFILAVALLRGPGALARWRMRRWLTKVKTKVKEKPQ